jgi:lipid-A-disaccharide synthase-like uncharacterized protein
MKFKNLSVPEIDMQHESEDLGKLGTVPHHLMKFAPSAGNDMIGCITMRLPHLWWTVQFVVPVVAKPKALPIARWSELPFSSSFYLSYAQSGY